LSIGKREIYEKIRRKRKVTLEKRYSTEPLKVGSVRKGDVLQGRRAA